MYFPDKKRFLRLAKRGNIIPVYKEISADFETPLSAFIKIDDGKNSFLLESVEGEEKIGRYSFIGSRPSVIIESKGDKIKFVDSRPPGRPAGFRGNDSKVRNIKADPLVEVERFMKGFKFVDVDGLLHIFIIKDI